MENKRTCPICGDKIIGRIDKKYCSDQCRTEYANKQNSYSNNYIRKINGKLRKNRRILVEFNPGGKTKIHRQMLADRGFDFRYFTSIYKTKNGKTYYFCYEYGYLLMEKDFIVLVARKAK